MKVVLITNIPTPYRIPFFRKISELLEQEGHHFEVFFAAAGYAHRKWNVNLENGGFKYRFLESVAIAGNSSEQTSFSYRGISKIINESKATHVIVPGFSRASLRLSLASLFQNYQLIMWTGSVSHQTDGFLKRIYRKWIVRRMKHFITYSQSSANYLIKLGASADRINVSLNTVDLDFFSRAYEKNRRSQPKHENVRLGYVGYLTERKEVHLLISLFEAVHQKYPDCELHLAGDGDQRERLEKMVQRQGLEKQVHFHGYLQQEQLPAFLAQTDIFLYQTSFDIWGLVLNEAMASGLPCMSSINAVSSRELIRHAENGYLVDFQEIERCEQLLSILIESPKLREDFGKRAKQDIFEQASIEQSAHTFVTAIYASQHS